MPAVQHLLVGWQALLAARSSLQLAIASLTFDLLLPWRELTNQLCLVFISPRIIRSWLRRCFIVLASAGVPSACSKFFLLSVSRMSLGHSASSGSLVRSDSVGRAIIGEVIGSATVGGGDVIGGTTAAGVMAGIVIKLFVSALLVAAFVIVIFGLVVIVLIRLLLCLVNSFVIVGAVVAASGGAHWPIAA